MYSKCDIFSHLYSECFYIGFVYISFDLFDIYEWILFLAVDSVF